MVTCCVCVVGICKDKIYHNFLSEKKMPSQEVHGWHIFLWVKWALYGSRFKERSLACHEGTNWGVIVESKKGKTKGKYTHRHIAFCCLLYVLNKPLFSLSTTTPTSNSEEDNEHKNFRILYFKAFIIIGLR
jgi:hypothetical protein